MNPVLYLEHLSDSDLDLLARVAVARDTATFLVHLRADPAHFDTVLASPELDHALFAGGTEESLLRASPFLVFAVLVSRVRAYLAGASYVEEWVAPQRRMPVFDVSDLREFAADPANRLFLAEVLASYTRVFSGSAWTRTRRGWRRSRFSELDPVRLLQLAESSPSTERQAIYRRLGDLSLFLTSVFPDYAAVRPLSLVQRGRLHRHLFPSEANYTVNNGGDLPLLEQLGRRSYQLAGQTAETGLIQMASDFSSARRVLNVLTDRYLFPYRRLWFPLPES